LFLVVTIVTRRRARLRTDPSSARRHAAGRTARIRIGETLKDSDPARQMNGLAGAVTGFLSDHYGLPPGELTPSDIRALLHDRAADGPIVDEVAGFLEACDVIRFAPGSTDGVSSEEAAARVRRWIAEIEKSTS